LFEDLQRFQVILDEPSRVLVEPWVAGDGVADARCVALSSKEGKPFNGT
jgi:hypothetical protein